MLYLQACELEAGKAYAGCHGPWVEAVLGARELRTCLQPDLTAAELSRAACSQLIPLP